MERELWPQLYHAIRAMGREFHQQSVQYQPWVIVLVLVQQCPCLAATSRR